MIQTIYLRERKDGVKLFLTYSDKGVYIHPVDRPNSKYSYVIEVESKIGKYEETFVKKHPPKNE